MALTDSLVSYWRMDESSGNRRDNWGANTLTDNNSTASATGKIASGADFESGSSNYMNNAAPVGLPTGSSARSIQAWVKFESLPSATEMWIFDYGTSSANQRWNLAIIESSGIKMHMDVSGRAVASTLSTGFTTGTWYHLVMTYDGTNVSWYINGTLLETVAAGTINTVVTDMYVGVRNSVPTNPRYFDGVIDEVAIWSRALTSGEITSLYNAGTGAYPFEVHFDNSSGGVAGAATSLTYSHTCTGSNRALFVGILAGANGDTVSGVTYGGVSMTLQDKQVATSGYMYSFVLVNPSTGANNVVISSSTNDIWSASASYAGAKQTTQPEAHGTALTASGTTHSESLTSLTDGAWHVSWMRSSANMIIAAGANTIKRQSPNTSTEMMICDSKIISPAGSNTLNASGTSGQWTSNGVILKAFSASVFPPNRVYTVKQAVNRAATY